MAKFSLSPVSSDTFIQVSWMILHPFMFCVDSTVTDITSWVSFIATLVSIYHGSIFLYGCCLADKGYNSLIKLKWYFGTLSLHKTWVVTVTQLLMHTLFSCCYEKVAMLTYILINMKFYFFSFKLYWSEAGIQHLSEVTLPLCMKTGRQAWLIMQYSIHSVNWSAWHCRVH